MQESIRVEYLTLGYVSLEYCLLFHGKGEVVIIIIWGYPIIDSISSLLLEGFTASTTHS